MAVTIKDVEYIAKLAMLKFSDAEKETFTHQLNEILGYMEQLNALDTTNVEPLSHVIKLENVFRNDVQRQGVSTAEALLNAPVKSEQFFKVPKVIDENS